MLIKQGINKYSNKEMNEWMNEWLNEYMIDWVNEWLSEWLSEWVQARMPGRGEQSQASIFPTSSLGKQWGAKMSFWNATACFLNINMIQQRSRKLFKKVILNWKWE